MSGNATNQAFAEDWAHQFHIACHALYKPATDRKLLAEDLELSLLRQFLDEEKVTDEGQINTSVVRRSFFISRE
jgi:hypothetical protein